MTKPIVWLALGTLCLALFFYIALGVTGLAAPVT